MKVGTVLCSVFLATSPQTDELKLQKFMAVTPGLQWPLNKILGDELRPNHSPMTRMNSESPKTEGKIKGLSFLLHNHLYYFHNKHRKLQPPVSYKCTDLQGEMTSYHK